MKNLISFDEFGISNSRTMNEAAGSLMDRARELTKANAPKLLASLPAEGGDSANPDPATKATTLDGIKRGNKVVLDAMVNEVNAEVGKHSSILGAAFVESFIKPALKKAIEGYGKSINGDANEILSQIKSGNGNATASLYIKTLKKSIYDEINNLNPVIKSTVSGMYSAKELKEVFKSPISAGHFDRFYDWAVTLPYAFISNPEIPKELKWQNDAYDYAQSKKKAVIDELINWTAAQFD